MQHYILMYLLAPFLFDIITHLDAKKCYVCGPKSYEPFRSIKNAEKTTNQNNKQIVTDIKATKTLINTNEEDSTNDESLYTRSCDILEKYIQNQDVNLMNEFVKECPQNYLGCLTQKDVNQTTRTCEFVAFNDCHPANGVTYCYCSDDLCNDKLTLPTEPDKPKINYQNDRNNNNRYSDENSDDEDISDEESSGMGEKLKTFTSKTNNKGTSNGNNHSTKVFTINTFQINFIIVLLISFKFFIKIF